MHQYCIACANTNRRLSPQVLNQDVDSLNGLKTVTDYTTTRPEAAAATLQQAYQTMLVQQQEETERLAMYRAAADAARLAEWEFHNAILANSAYCLIFIL